MPRGDGTGPEGMGSMTGGGRGFCGRTAPTQNFLGFGCRLGGGVRGSMRRRDWFRQRGPMQQQKFQNISSVNYREDVVALLKDQAEVMTQQLASIQKQISELESAANE